MLPPTYVEFIRKFRPFLFDYVQEDINKLVSTDNCPDTIGWDDVAESRMRQCLQATEAKMLEEAAKFHNVDTEAVKPIFEMEKTSGRFGFLAQQVQFEYYCLFNFMLNGEKVFHFSDNLVEHLAHTDINMNASYIQLPFPSCLFVLTSETAINALHNIRGKEGRISMNNNKIDYTAPISVFVTLRPVGLGMKGNKLVILAFHARLPNRSYLTTKRELYLNEEWNLEQALRTDWDTLSPDNSGYGHFANSDECTSDKVGDDLFYTDGLLFFRIVLNAILYLSSEHAETQAIKSQRPELEAKAKEILSAPKRQKILKNAAQHSSLNYDEVGGSIGKIIIKYNEGDESGIVGVGGGEPNVRFKVRGHWRGQAFGPGGIERKIIWIRPYWKGPDLAKEINKPYLVE
ncbi:hypothetical protein MCAMS1_02819 [biofilm metagenome]